MDLRALRVDFSGIDNGHNRLYVKRLWNRRRLGDDRKLLARVFKRSVPSANDRANRGRVDSRLPLFPRARGLYRERRVDSRNGRQAYARSLFRRSLPPDGGGGRMALLLA